MVRGEENLSTYTFNTHKLKHRFCSTCGVQGFAEGQDKDGKETRAVNLRAVRPGAGLAQLAIERPPSPEEREQRKPAIAHEGHGAGGHH